MTMPTRPRLVFAIFFLTAVLIFTIHIRTASSRVFNCFCKAQAQKKILLQELRTCQLRFESLITPRRLLEQIHVDAESESSSKKSSRQ
jgi:hypothetical protein